MFIFDLDLLDIACNLSPSFDDEDDAIEVEDGDGPCPTPGPIPLEVLILFLPKAVGVVFAESFLCTV